MQCVQVLMMSLEKAEAVQDVQGQMSMAMGPQMAQMMSGAISQGMDMEMMMAKQMCSQEIPDNEAAELLTELDADGDGVVSKRDFLTKAKKTLFDPNPPEELMQMMDMIQSAVSGGPQMLGGQMPLAITAGGPAAHPMSAYTGAPMCMPPTMQPPVMHGYSAAPAHVAPSAHTNFSNAVPRPVQSAPSYPQQMPQQMQRPVQSPSAYPQQMPAQGVRFAAAPQPSTTTYPSSGAAFTQGAYVRR